MDTAFALAPSERLLLGFDFPIGMPETYGVISGLHDFQNALKIVGNGEWKDFFAVATDIEEISVRRPFYPNVAIRGVSRVHLLEALKVSSFEQLLRVCERRTAYRQAACSLFWTLGGNQVGKAAISGWVEVIKPALMRGARLWPFDGGLGELSHRPGVAIAETYPAEAYRLFGAKFARSESKRNQIHRASKATSIKEWAAGRLIQLAPELTSMIDNGFGGETSGEDAFDAFAGLAKMIAVAEGQHPEASVDLAPTLAWEGWILGR